MPHAIPDISATLKKVEEYGIIEEDAGKIDQRLELAVVDVASSHPSTDLGVKESANKFLSELKMALHQELCDPQKKALKEEYNNLLGMGLTADGVQAVAAVVTKVAAVINPTFLVSSVVVYASIWLLKVGLNHWCSIQ